MPNVPVLALEAFALVLAIAATGFTRSVAQIETIPDSDILRAYETPFRTPPYLTSLEDLNPHYFRPSGYYDTISWQCALVPQ